MTKRYGALVGAVKNLIPMRPVDAAYENTKDSILVRDVVTLAAAPIADVVSLGFFGWEDVLDVNSSDINFDAMGAASTLSVGDVSFPAALAAATATSAAGTLKACKTVTNANAWKPLWAQLGYATLAAAQLIGSNCELLGTIAGGAMTGSMSWQFKGQKRI